MAKQRPVVLSAVLSIAAQCTPARPEREAAGADRHAIAGPRGDGGVPSAVVKGLRPRLVIHRQRASTIEELDPADRVYAGDAVQVSYVAAGSRHGVVLSIDGDGHVTLHHPSTAQGSTRIEPRGRVSLPHAFVLDDAPRFERFVFVTTGRDPADVGAIIAAADAVARGPAPETTPLRLDADTSQTSFVLRKDR